MTIDDVTANVGVDFLSPVLQRHKLRYSQIIKTLFAHPLLVWGAGMGAMALGLPITPFALSAMVLAAALPSASNVSLLAERLGADNGRIARIILVSTAAAFLTFSGAVSLTR